MLISDEKLKLVKILLELHFGTCGWFGGCGTLKTLLKALILSKSLNKCKLDSLAYSFGMRVFAYMIHCTYNSKLTNI